MGLRCELNQIAQLLGQVHFSTAVGSEMKNGFYSGREKEPTSHLYMYSPAYCDNYCNPLTPSLYHPPYIGLKVSLLIDIILM
jgi:hypothetical protein